MNEREIFEAVLDITNAEERQAYLAEVCGGDGALQERVATLLAAHAAASQFLREPAVGGEATAATMRQEIDAEGSIDCDGDWVCDANVNFLSPSSKPGSIGTLGHYEILQILGQGAFGIVFKAFDEKLLRHVAIKAMNPQLAATSPPRKRFLREARSVAAVKHENIVQIYAVEEQPLPYLVMEYIEGCTLQQRLDGTGPLEVQETLYLGRQMAAGLAAAHDKGLIHRDIKPGNILIEAGAELKVKITDFGLARAADDATMTRTGTIAGTPMYMAPEQAMGLDLDHRADLFSLGSVLYQMASGRPPFRGSNAIVVLKRVVDEEPRAIKEILSEVPDWLCQIIAKLHAKAPEDRYQSARELAELLGRCQSEWQLTGTVTVALSANGAVAAVNSPTPVSSTSLPLANRELKGPDTLTKSGPHAGSSTKSSQTVAGGASPLRWGIAATLLLLVMALTWAYGQKLYTSVLSRPQENVANLPSVDIPQQELEENDPSPATTTTAVISTTASAAQTTATADSERELAEWVLSLPGSRSILLEGLNDELRNRDAVPTGPTRIKTVMAGVDCPIGKAEFAEILTAKGLDQLILHNSPDLSDDDLSALVDSPSAATLSQLYLSESKCTDQVFQHLSRLRNLDSLGVGGAQLTDVGFQQLSLPQLTSLSLSGQQITPGCLKEMSPRLPKLATIVMYSSYPNVDLTPLTKWPLTSLAIASNAEGIARISRITSLKKLRLMGNQGIYQDQDLNALSTLAGLQSLTLESTSLTYENVHCFEKFSNLLALALCHTRCSDKGLENVLKARTIEHLNISDTKISDQGLALFETMPSLAELIISQNPQLTEKAVRKLQAALPKCRVTSDFSDLLTPTTPTLTETPIDYVAERKAAERLLRLDKGQATIRLHDQPVFQPLKYPLPDGPFCIVEVNFSGADITNDELAALSGCQELEKLNCDGNQKLTHVGLAKLSPQRKLKFLLIGSTQVGDEGLQWLAQSTSLIELAVVGAPLTASGWQSLPSLPCLRHLYQWDQGLDNAGLQRIVDQCPELRSLHLGGSGNSLNDLTPISKLARLQQLHTDAKILNDAAIEVLLQSPVLDELQVTNPAPEAIERLQRLNSKLTKLSLIAYGPGKDSDSSELWAPYTKLSQLLELSIHGNLTVDGSGLKRIAAMPCLRKLTFGHSAEPTKYRTFTPVDVSNFRKARPDVELVVGEQVHPALDDWPGKSEGSRHIAEWTGLPPGSPVPLAITFSPEQAKEAQEAWARCLGQPREVSNSIGMTFQLIPAGESMAKIQDQGQSRYVWQRLLPFYLGTTEVTVGQFKKFVEATGYLTDAERLKIGRNTQAQVDPAFNWKTPGFAIADELPVCVISQADALAFCDWLNKLETQPNNSEIMTIYRLPTRAELRHSTEAGDEGLDRIAGNRTGIVDYAWVKENTTGLSTLLQPVATRKANPFGLYDMLGNVWEWSREDNGSAPGVVGGSIYEDSAGVVNRFVPGNEWVQPNVGFRIVKQIQPSRRIPKFAEQPILIPRHTLLAPQANVTRPEPIQGIRSWTIELESTTEAVTSMSWSSKGDLIATTSGDSCARLWDRDGQLRSILFGPAGRRGAGQFVRFSPDGTRLAAVEMSTEDNSLNSLRVWDIIRVEQQAAGGVATRLIATVPLQYWGLGVDWSPDGRFIAYAGTQGLASILNVATGDVRALKTESEVSSIAWSSDSRLLCLPVKGIPTIFDTDQLQITGTLSLPDLPAAPIYGTRVAWSPDGRWIATSYGKKIWISDAETRQSVRVIDTEHLAIYAIGWHKDSRLIDVAGHGGSASLTIVDSNGGTTVARSPGWGDQVAFARSPDQSEVVICTEVLQFLDGKTCQPVRRGPPAARNRQDWEGTPAFLSLDGKRVVTKSSEQLIFDAESGQLTERRKMPSGRLLAVAPDEAWRALETSETEVIVEPKAFDRDSITIRTPGHSLIWRTDPAGKYLAQAIAQELWIWETSTGKALDKRVYPAKIRGFEWSPDGQQIATAADDKIIRIWDTTLNKIVSEFQSFPEELTARGMPTDGPAMAWAQDGRNLWIPLGGQAGLLELSTGKVSLLEQFTNDGIIHTMTVAPDGDQLLVRGGYQITSLRGRNGQHHKLGQYLGHRPQWHPDSRRFLSGGDLFGVRGYDVATRRRLGTLWPILEGDHWLCIGPTGHYQGSAGIEEHIVYVAQLDDGSEVTLSPPDFATRFHWKNDPQKATLLKLSEQFP